MKIKDIYICKRGRIIPQAKIIVTPYTDGNGSIYCRFETENANEEKDMRKAEILISKRKLKLLRLFCNSKMFEVRTTLWFTERDRERHDGSPFFWSSPIEGVYGEDYVAWRKQDYGRKLPVNN